MIERRKELETIEKLLKRNPIVGITGARQVGRTTLAQQFAEKAGAALIYKYMAWSDKKGTWALVVPNGKDKNNNLFLKQPDRIDDLQLQCGLAFIVAERSSLGTAFSGS